MTGALKTLFAVAENYPQLKADQNFVHLQQRITDLEETIADRREFLNDSGPRGEDAKDVSVSFA